MSFWSFWVSVKYYTSKSNKPTMHCSMFFSHFRLLFISIQWIVGCNVMFIHNARRRIIKVAVNMWKEKKNYSKPMQTYLKAIIDIYLTHCAAVDSPMRNWKRLFENNILYEIFWVRSKWILYVMLALNFEAFIAHTIQHSNTPLKFIDFYVACSIHQ